MTARALSVQQPHAWAITDLDKRVENRNRATSFRGEVFIHASAKARPVTDLRGQATPQECAIAETALLSQRMPLGAIVAVAELYDCQRDDGATVPAPDQRRWAEPRSCWWLLGQVKKLPEPVPCKGALGFWKVPPDVEAEVRRQLDMAKKKPGKPYPPTQEQLPDGAGAPEPRTPNPEPPANSREDLGYTGEKGEKPLSPEQRRQLERLAREIATASKDVEAKASARGSAGAALKEAQKQLRRLIAEQNAVIAGNWQPGMFDADPDDEDPEDEGEEE